MIGGAQSHQELPFEHLVDALLPERNLAHNPLFQFKINQHVAASDAGRKRLGALEVEGFARDGGDARFDLAFDFSDKADGIEGYFTYANDLFEQATIERMAASLRQVLDALIRDPQQAIVDSPQLATLLPAATQAYPHGNFLALWRQAMAQGQAHGGVRAGDRFMTQAGLEAASNRLADYLRQHGVGAGSIVALCLPRSIEWVGALLAVLKTGAAYLPLDTQQPQERLQQLIADSGAAILLHEPGDQRFAGLDGVQRIACDHTAWATCSDSPVEVAIAAEQPAYLIYTSGSTGQPKGVVVSHGRWPATPRRCWSACNCRPRRAWRWCPPPRPTWATPCCSVPWPRAACCTCCHRNWRSTRMASPATWRSTRSACSNWCRATCKACCKRPAPPMCCPPRH